MSGSEWGVGEGEFSSFLLYMNVIPNLKKGWNDEGAKVEM